MPHFPPTQIELDSPQWLQAVDLKRERAFTMLEEMEGLTGAEIEPRYGAYRQEQGIGFHGARQGFHAHLHRPVRLHPRRRVHGRVAQFAQPALMPLLTQWRDYGKITCGRSLCIQCGVSKDAWRR